jgi:8-oxo-dGTP diphosphatase
MRKTTIESEDDLIYRAKAENIERFVVGAIIGRYIENTLEVLVVERTCNDFMSGIEELPSGKVEFGETLLEALKREVFEETNLELLEVLGFIFKFDYFSSNNQPTRQFNYAVRAKEGQVRLCSSEHCNCRWLKREDIRESKLTDNVKQSIFQSWNYLVSVFKQSAEDGSNKYTMVS